ncbi:MAG: hypothetical protein WC101_01050 [Candidatus Gracilibacteria bacterium]
MKKISIILASVILSMTLFTATQAAVGIPDYLVPKNAGLQDLNTAIQEKVNAANNNEAGNTQQDAAVSAFNIVLQYIANLLLFIAAPLAVMFIVRAGGDYAFAMGEDTQIENAKRELTWALLGLALVMFSYLIVRLIIQPFPVIQGANDKQATQKQATEQKAAADQAAEQKKIEDNMTDTVETLP